MSKTLDRADEEARNKAATGTSHAFVYIDEVLKVKTDGYTVQITLGWTSPNESYAPVATVAMPASFAKELADVLMGVHKQAAKLRAPGG